MKATKDIATKPLSAEQQLKSFIARFEPKHQSLFRSVRKALRARFPSAGELAYDYSTSVVIGYSPTDRGIDSPVAISLTAEGLRLFFNQGPKLPDPKKILLGSGKATRFIWIESPKTLKLPEVEAFLETTIYQAKTRFRAGERGKLTIKSSPAIRRPRRKPKR